MKQVPIIAAVLKDENGKVLIHKRGSEGLLANLWEFPNCEAADGQASPEERLEAFLKEQYGVQAQLGQPFLALEHAFSHLIWDITVYDGKIAGKFTETEQLKLVGEKEIESYAFPVSHQRIWEEYKQKTGGLFHPF